MSEAFDILRSYAGVVSRLAGAASASLYVPPGAGGEREILIQSGPLPPVPELSDAAKAAAFVARVRGLGEGVTDGRPTRLASEDEASVLVRIPLRWVALREAPDFERRKTARRRMEPEAWVGLRFLDRSRPAADAGVVPASATDVLHDEEWWNAFLGLGAAFAVHTRSLSRRLLDQVTGLPDRHEFQTVLASVLAQQRSTVLALVSPDDFGWVNERLDRRSGDRVLREIALALRAATRRQDDVARYGGAIFAVVLRDSALEEGRHAAENVVRRLAEERYHQRLLRLEFSAGIAASDAAEAIDAQELVRRADQALSAAKRGQAGNVRAWEKGSDVELASSVDRLQGIFTGDKSKDYRNMRLLLETVTAIAAAGEPAELARGFTARLFETLGAVRALVVERVGDGFAPLSGLARERPAEETPPLDAEDLALLERASSERRIVTRDGSSETTLCALPLLLEQRCLGGILLEVSAGGASLEGSDRQFLDALACEMAIALDRARLAEREKNREREEKERLFAEVQDLRRVLHGSRLVYRSAAMESLLATARKVARTDTTVLITGESGTGKEMLAYTLHELSERSERPMVVVDCSSIAPSLIESELFGHEKGAFTGAHARNPGRLAQAQGATVFLDEIGDLPLDLQSKLLRFVQEKQFTPVGGVSPRKVDVRIIAATNVDLQARVAQGRFREDLYHRLNVVRLQVPPLRERKDDVLHLANAFLKQFAALYRRPAHHFTAEAERALRAHAWTGNVRELQNVVLTSALFCESPEVDAADLQLPGAAAAAPVGGSDSGSPGPEDPRDPAARFRDTIAAEIASALASGRPPLPLGRWLAQDLVLAADRLAGGGRRKGAELLGLPETTYRRQLQHAQRQRSIGLAARSASWANVVRDIEDLVGSKPAGRDVCAWAEACLLAEIDSAAPGDVRTAAALVGVTETTVLRRSARSRRS